MRHFPSPLARIAGFALALLCAGPGSAAEAVPDPDITTYGTLNAAAPPELATFAFLVGTWSGTARARDAEGQSTEYQFDWIGRYALDGRAIADEMRMSAAEGGAIQGMSLRYFDRDAQSWVVEFLNFNRAFLRQQVNSTKGSVTREGNRITVHQGAPGGQGREVYTLVAADHFTYSMDRSQDGGQTWDEGIVLIDMKRQEAP